MTKSPEPNQNPNMALYSAQNLLAQIEAHKLANETLTERLEEEKVKVQHLEHMLTSKERDLVKQTELVDKRDVEIRMLKEALVRRGLEEPVEAAPGGRRERGGEDRMNEVGKEGEKRALPEDGAAELHDAR